MQSIARNEVARDLTTFRKKQKGRRSRPQSASHSRPQSATQRSPPAEQAQQRARSTANVQGESVCAALPLSPSALPSPPLPSSFVSTFLSPSRKSALLIASPSVSSRVLYEGKAAAGAEEDEDEDNVDEEKKSSSSSSVSKPQRKSSRKFKPPPSSIYGDELLATNAPARRKLQRGRSSKRGTFFGAIPQTFSPAREMQERAKAEVSPRLRNIAGYRRVSLN